MLQLVKEKDRSSITTNSLNESQQQEIYNFWLKKEYSIESVDRRTGRDKVKSSKKENLKLYNNIQNQKVQLEKKALKSGGKHT